MTANITAQEKAQIAIAARDNKSIEWLQLLFALVIKTGLDAQECEKRIEALARGEQC